MDNSESEKEHSAQEGNSECD